MSQEDVKLVQAVFAAFARRDFDAVAPIVDPEIEVRPAIAGGPEGIVYRGLEGFRDFWAEVDAAWEDFGIEPSEFRDLDGVVLVLGQAHARGRGSGISLESPAGWLAVLREGRIVRFQSFTSREAALQAAGLSE
jgi:ketosteroid isomerase-like protein